MKVKSRLKQAALVAVVLALFWLAAAVTSAIPARRVLGTKVDSLNLANYRSDVIAGLTFAPLTNQIIQDAYRDALGDSFPGRWSWFTDPGTGTSQANASPAAPSRPASPPPSATATASSTHPKPTPSIPVSATPSPTPTAMPAPTPAPTPTPTATPTLSPTPTPTPSPVPTGRGSIVGLVTNGKNRQPIAGATVVLTPIGATTTTNPTGDFSFASLAPGTYTVTASAAGHSPVSRTITLKSGGKVNVTLAL